MTDEQKEVEELAKKLKESNIFSQSGCNDETCWGMIFNWESLAEFIIKEKYRKSPSSGLEPLDEKKVLKLFQDEWTYLENEVGASTTTLFIYQNLIQILIYVSSRFGRPKTLSLRDIEWILKDYDITSNCGIPLSQALKKAIDSSNTQFKTLSETEIYNVLQEEHPHIVNRKLAQALRSAMESTNDLY